MAQDAGNSDKFVIRKAEPQDCEEIVRLIKELAEFEKMADQVKMTAEILRKDCFGERPLCSCIVSSTEADQSRLIGYALFFPKYSTWEGLCVHLEDLYVTPDHRYKGIGKRMWQSVAQTALEMGSSRLELAVLGWNKNAKDMYERNGCVDLTTTEDWHLMRMDRSGMEKFVQQGCS